MPSVNLPYQQANSIYCYDWFPKGETFAFPQKGICFVPSDLSSVAHVRSHLEKIANQFALSEQSIFELALVADELVTNAILANFAKGHEESILLKWSVKDFIFTLTVLDYGGGFKIGQVFHEIPRGGDLASFLRSLKEYRDSRKAMIPLNGKLIEHTRFGRGLRIISHLVQHLDIIFHDYHGGMEQTPNEKTIGSIITIEYAAEAA